MSPNEIKPILPTFNVASLTPLLDVAWKVGLSCSVVLYTIGLVISNIHAGLFGRYGLGLDKASYINVGLLWAFFAMLGYLMFKRIRSRWQPGSLDNKGRKTSRLFRVTWTVFDTIMSCGSLYVLIVFVTFLPSDPFDRQTIRQTITLFFVVMLTGVTINVGVQHLKRPFAIQTWPLSPWALALAGDALDVVTQYVPWLMVMIFSYAYFVYPLLPTAFGGGALQNAEVFVKPGSQTFKSINVPVKDNNSIGLWFVVVELPDSLVLTDKTALSHKNSRTIWVRKDNIDALVHVTGNSPTTMTRAK